MSISDYYMSIYKVVSRDFWGTHTNFVCVPTRVPANQSDASSADLIYRPVYQAIHLIYMPIFPFGLGHTQQIIQ